MQSRKEMTEIMIRAHEGHLEECRNCPCKDCVAWVMGVEDERRIKSI